MFSKKKSAKKNFLTIFIIIPYGLIWIIIN